LAKFWEITSICFSFKTAPDKAMKIPLCIFHFLATIIPTQVTGSPGTAGPEDRFAEGQFPLPSAVPLPLPGLMILNRTGKFFPSGKKCFRPLVNQIQNQFHFSGREVQNACDLFRFKSFMGQCSDFTLVPDLVCPQPL